jgi:hypothetical protein
MPETVDILEVIDLTMRALHFYPDGAADKAANLGECKSSRCQLLDSDG